MNKKRLLLIFAKQVEKGKVKTRLAKTIGHDKALLIYQDLLQHTAQQTATVQAERWVCYSPNIEQKDAFSPSLFNKRMQFPGDLGERMLNAFKEGFQAGYEHILLIGSDIYELRTDIIEDAFELLEQKEVIFGPAQDGGYYLVGLKQLIPSIFLNKQWSHSRVLADALDTLTASAYSFGLVETLNDIDEEKDLPKILKEKYRL